MEYSHQLLLTSNNRQDRRNIFQYQPLRSKDCISRLGRERRLFGNNQGNMSQEGTRDSSLDAHNNQRLFQEHKPHTLLVLHINC